jgi:ATP-binding cassette subfamily B protein
LFSSDKDIILLDESTSSVDPENETEIYQRIFAAFHQKTIIASIHKMNLLKLFDRIVIFDEGKIVDEGTFTELMRRNEDFKASFEQFVSTH